MTIESRSYAQITRKMSEDDMTEKTQGIHFQLDDNERLLWSGKPSLRKVFSNVDKFLVPFGLLLGAGAAYPTWTLIDNILYFSRNSGSFDVIWIFPLAITAVLNIVALYIVFGRWLVKTIVKRNIRYSITTERSVVTNRSKRINPRSIRLSEVTCRAVTYRWKKFGTIQFNSTTSSGNPIAILWLEIPFIYPRSHKVTLFDVANVDEVIRILDSMTSG
jgi:hypothetical protein